jgi:hypothetical protein
LSPIKLSDEELDAIMRAAAPIDPDQRDQFLQAVYSALAACHEIGPGAVYLVCRSVQKQFFHPPIPDSHEGRHGPNRGIGKYARL